MERTWRLRRQRHIGSSYDYLNLLALHQARLLSRSGLGVLRARAAARSGQVRFITRPKSRTMRPSEINVRELTERMCPNEQRAESDSVMVMNLESLGVDGAGYDETETEPPSSTNPQ